MEGKKRRNKGGFHLSFPISLLYLCTLLLAVLMERAGGAFFYFFFYFASSATFAWLDHWLHKQERDPFTDLRRLLQSSDLTLTGILSDLD